ncbi:phosphatase PAP2 family protein [Pedococcus bigeumensis]|uniref:Phosphatase PAP2 family protein n=1 Tax=Pedococcus bigeumensis TaxID=433644 RepID=A0A502CMH1_9MICO|nr:phosphatase PAP2 family protein [Pedococcus bigeumensis]TPG13972.1 phosphatase PAP2 family protein [Pedococcus bigeumensis]
MSDARPPDSAPPPVRTGLRGWRRAGVELAGLVVGLFLFSRLRNLAGTDVRWATENAHALQAVERGLSLDVEVAVNHWLASHPTLMVVAVLYYRLYYLPVVGVLLWVLVRHPRAYRTIRRTLIVMLFLALLVFWLVPLSPPRFALPGIIDIVAEHDPVAGKASRDLTTGQNHFSAMPSLHVAWCALGAYAAWLALRGKHPRLARLPWLLPVGMVPVVIGTGNHYVLDVAGSVLLLALSIAASASWQRHGRLQLHRPRGRNRSVG